MIERQRNARGKGSNLRAEILESSRRLLERTGNEDAITLRAVARETQISAPSIYAHFANSSEIRDTLITETFAEFEGILRDAKDLWIDPIDRLLSMGVAYLRFGTRNPARYLTMFERRRSPEKTNQDTAAGRPGGGIRGEAAFNILVEVLCVALRSPETQAAPGRPQADAALLWVGLHGYVTLRACSPHFSWALDENHMCAELISRTLSASEELDQRLNERVVQISAKTIWLPFGQSEGLET